MKIFFFVFPGVVDSQEEGTTIFSFEQILISKLI